MAFFISGFECPIFATRTPELQSSHLLPYLSNTFTPDAWSQTASGCPDIDLGSYFLSLFRTSIDLGTGNLSETIFRKGVQTFWIFFISIAYSFAIMNASKHCVPDI